jgi:chemotaxis protein methyltransferase CheR
LIGFDTTRRNHAKLDPQSFRELRDFIYEQSGIFFSEKKMYLLEGRLTGRLHDLNLNSFRDYIRYVKHGFNQKEELKNIFNLVTINETYFFRYDKQLSVFSEKLLPEVIEQRRAQNRNIVRIWSAGCSTGEEVYTLAMLIKENLNGVLSEIKFELLGTDISHKVLEKARQGVFGKNSFRGSMPMHYKSKYFSMNGQWAEIHGGVRELVQFKYLNLNDIHQIRLLRGMDFIFCRNVLIYFDEVVKKRVIRAFYDVLNHGGYLALGEAESLHGVSSALKVEHFPGAFLYKKE